MGSVVSKHVGSDSPVWTEMTPFSPQQRDANVILLVRESGPLPSKPERKQVEGGGGNSKATRRKTSFVGSLI